MPNITTNHAITYTNTYSSFHVWVISLGSSSLLAYSQPTWLYPVFCSAETEITVTAPVRVYYPSAITGHAYMLFHQQHPTVSTHLIYPNNRVDRLCPHPLRDTGCRGNKLKSLSTPPDWSWVGCFLPPWMGLFHAVLSYFRQRKKKGISQKRMDEDCHHLFVIHTSFLNAFLFKDYSMEAGKMSHGYPSCWKAFDGLLVSYLRDRLANQ